MKMHFIKGIFLIAILTACNGRTEQQPRHKVTTPANSNVSGSKTKKNEDFDEFLDRFSKDSVFQVSRTQLPLKVIWYDMDTERDSVIYKDRQHLEIIDFRKKRYDGRYDRWEQKRFIDRNGSSARIEIRGIDNGIYIDCFFKKVSGAWMLIEINDSST